MPPTMIGGLMKRAWLCIELAFSVVFIGLLVLTLMLAWHIVSRRLGATKDFWDVLTAVGTMGAVVVAVGIALRQERLRRAEDLVSAQVTAARLIPQLTFAADDLGTIEAWLDFYETIERPEPAFFTSILRRVELASVNLTTADLRSLAPLPNRCAFRLAKGIGHVGLLRELMRERLARIHDEPFSEEEAIDFARHAGEAKHALQISLTECLRAVGELAEVTDEERFGPFSNDDID